VTDSETTKYLACFLLTAKGLGFAETEQEAPGEMVLKKGNVELLILVQKGIWLLVGDDDLEADGNFLDGDYLAYVVGTS